MTSVQNTSNTTILQQAQQQQQAATARQSKIDKTIDTIKANTADGTFIGDNMFLTGAGTLVGGVAGVAGVAKLADKFPAVEKALEFTFVDNGKLVAGAAALGASALLAEDAKIAYENGNTARAAGMGAGALATGLGSVELVGRQYNIPVAREALSTPLQHIAKHSKGIAGAGIATAGVLVAKSGLDDLREGSTMLGGAKLAGGSAAALAGAEMVGRRYDIPVMKEAFSKPAELVADNVKAITGVVAAAGGTAAIVSGVNDLKEGENLKGGAKVAGGAVAILGGAELVGRQYNIPVMKDALTGTAKALFTSKGGMIASGVAVAGAGLAAGADGVRRLTTEKGILNDVIGTAEVTAAVAATTGGASLIGHATQNEKLVRAFPESLPILGGVALVAASASMGKYTVEDIKENGFDIHHVATGTGSALAALGGTQMIAEKMGVPVLDRVFEKGLAPIAAVGLGATAYKLGEVTLDQGKQMIEAPGVGRGLLTAGAAAGTVLAGSGAVAMAGRALNLPGVEKAGMSVINGTKNGAVKGAELAMDKVIEPVMSFAVKNPGITLGALAVAGGAGYYFYQQNKNSAN